MPGARIERRTLRAARLEVGAMCGAKRGRILAAARLIAGTRFDPAIQRHLQLEPRLEFFDR
jgi:hypothetical protein